MTNEACREMEVAISLLAAGEIAPHDARAAGAHLADCARCRRELAAVREVIATVELAPPSPAETLAMRAVLRGVPAALRRAERRSASLRWVAVVTAAAASVLVLARVPAPSRAPGGPVARATWEQPSVDELWDATAVLEVDDDAGASESLDEVAGSIPGLEEP